LHITLSEELVRELDRRVGARRRSRFIAGAVRQALDDERRWEAIEAALGALDDEGHVWDEDPAAWVHEGRRHDVTRVG
jgi:Arc/MetJ-type ribon-helix-helix transcriptional regulator